MGIISDCLTNIGYEAAKQYSEVKLDESKLKKELNEFVIRQRKYNDLCLAKDECDFEGVLEYIKNDLIQEAYIRFFSAKTTERKRAHEEIIKKAIHNFNATSDESKKRVSRCIAVGLEIIRNFFKKNLKLKDYILAADIVDSVNENTVAVTNEQTDVLSKKIDDYQSGILEELRFKEMLMFGEDLGMVESTIKNVLDVRSTKHPLYPYFGYSYNGKRIVSVPLTDESRDKYPENYYIKGSILINGEYSKDKNMDPLNYAYRHQLRLTMKVEEAIKLLGNSKDPIQGEAKDLIGKEIVAVPPKFPESFACSLKVGKETFYNYILIRTQEILDDGTYILGNKEQENAKIYVEIHLNFKNTSSIDFLFHTQCISSEEKLQNALFKEALSKKKDIHLFVLSSQQDMMAGNVSDFRIETGFESIKEEIDFFERICDIERYFNVKLNVDGDIYKKDFDTVFHLSELIRNESVESTWDKLEMKGVLDPEFKELLCKLENPLPPLACEDTCKLVLFNVPIEYKFLSVYRSPLIADFEKFRKKLDALEIGDPIKIPFVPGDDNTMYETLHVPEEFQLT